MAREPQRSEQPSPLGAAIMPVQQALIARATALEEMAGSDAVVSSGPVEAVIMARVATEFRSLAAELRHW